MAQRKGTWEHMTDAQREARKRKMSASLRKRFRARKVAALKGAVTHENGAQALETVDLPLTYQERAAPSLTRTARVTAALAALIVAVVREIEEN